MKRIIPILSVVMLSGCVAISANMETTEDLVTGEEFYSFEIGMTYPKKQFMTAEEWLEYQQAPNSMKDVLYKTYKEREEIEEDWSNFINNCLLAGTFDC